MAKARSSNIITSDVDEDRVRAPHLRTDTASSPSNHLRRCLMKWRREY
ncbi:hypothetical protein F442_06380 [Phytophthora nicotianae P10297]|uniref:Uncharacterized protein n=4 Tax=Phytophthora nicotianae TaxID=4792 RepID=W2RAS6_PHYN3|nr:hypothetical protein PPTG_20933 [Phytophthora nicotianae INRA-310]ETI50017.1 hypothetical protein F443_06337 [Phytophthora nicotianae P1569]ETN22538.1 hypothetical protein PPTG_20933 [Phytophthora nicotianae INRA-310]ETO78742.1 hypothetical protein F444_06400 [Phytophthora nicotianae P1976]ETP47718.1 hypothetical protein F442_06380 [Phytophthora nicotianae P10297]